VVIVWGLHSPCTLQAGADVGSTIAGWPGSWWGKKRGRMEMCLWEGFVCQWALAWTDWKSLSFSLSHSQSFHFQLSPTLSLLWPILCQGTWGCCHSKILSSKALYSCDSKRCPPVWLSECMCVRMRVYSAFLLSCTQFCVCVSVLVWVCGALDTFYSTFIGQTDFSCFHFFSIYKIFLSIF